MVNAWAFVAFGAAVVAAAAGAGAEAAGAGVSSCFEQAASAATIAIPLASARSVGMDIEPPG